MSRPSLDRREPVRRTGANTVDVSDQDRWTVPLGKMMRRILSQDLAARLPKDTVVLPDSPSPPHTAQIVAAIAEFAPDANGRTTPDGSWSLLQGGHMDPVLRRDITLETSSSAGAASEAMAMPKAPISTCEHATHSADVQARCAPGHENASERHPPTRGRGTLRRADGKGTIRSLTGTPRQA